VTAFVGLASLLTMAVAFLVGEVEFGLTMLFVAAVCGVAVFRRG